MRIYAIGDVHGCIDLLNALLEKITEDDRSRAASESCLIFLGDLVDRGPDSAAVVARVRELSEAGIASLIKGNHDDVFARAASGSARGVRALLQMDGAATLHSYGITAEEVEHGSYEDLAALLVTRIPEQDVRFLSSAKNTILLGDYLFVHAGIRPGVALDEQIARDTCWIREPFLSSRLDHGAMVVHGHSIFPTVDVRSNRVGIDTGAYATGKLSAIGIEGSDFWILEVDNSPS